MTFITITGGYKLNGYVEISGAKNSALPILASSLLTDKSLNLYNIPKLVDVHSMIKLITSLGVEIISYNESLKIRTKNVLSIKANYDLVRKMRASFLVLGPLLAREGFAEVSLPGGCAIGSRPVDMHLYAMKKLGANIEFSDGYVLARCKSLVGNRVNFPKVSVGATENTIMAAVLAKGETLISNAAKEPEIVDLCNCLNAMGAKIEGMGSENIFIQGTTNLSESSHSIISDRIEACTYIIAAALTKSNISIRKVNFAHIESFLGVMDIMGLNYSKNKGEINVNQNQKLQSIKIKTEEFPGFPSDLQAQIMTLACASEGISEIEENIFENRFMHVPELNRLGAKIEIKGSKAIIHGSRNFIGAEVMATDLRASVSLILAGLKARGKTIINRIYHLDRGYEDIVKKLSNCGANIIRGKNGT